MTTIVKKLDPKDELRQSCFLKQNGRYVGRLHPWEFTSSVLTKDISHRFGKMAGIIGWNAPVRRLTGNFIAAKKYKPDFDSEMAVVIKTDNSIWRFMAEAIRVTGQAKTLINYIFQPVSDIVITS